MKSVSVKTIPVFILIVLYICANKAYSQEKKLRKLKTGEKAVTLLKLAREKSGAYAKTFESFTLVFNGTLNYAMEIEEMHEYKIMLSNKIHHKLLAKWRSGSGSNVNIWDGTHFSSQVHSIWNYGENSKTDSKTSEDPENESLKKLKHDTSLALLPIILDFAFIPVEYTYLGLAKTKDSRADVIEARIDEKLAFKLLFDKKTSRLVMMVKEFIDAGKPATRNFYLSNYKKNNGLMIPHKMIMTGVSTRNTNIFVEKNLVDFKINPKFKPEVFEIKPKKK